MTLALNYSARSDRGLVRANNEDSVYAGPRLLALADGMGGHAAGEVASQLVIAALAPLDDDEPGSDITGLLEFACREGNESIAEQIAEEPELDGMGTTLTAMLFSGTRAGLCHIGDSRAYLLRDGVLTQITRDDTFVQSLVDEGRITPEEASVHPRRSLIMKALTGEQIEPTLVVREVHVGDRYLICSDGLSDPVSFDTIHDCLASGTPAECADRLIDLALRSGGPDNVTVVVADVVEDTLAPTRPIVAGAVSDEFDAPPPDTAAGRAASMRRPAEPKRVVTTTGPDETAGTARLSRRSMLLSAIAVVAVLLAAAAVGIYLVRGKYQLGFHGDDERVVVYRGVELPLLGDALRDVTTIYCVGADNTITHHAADREPADCTPLTASDLSQSSRGEVAAAPVSTLEIATKAGGSLDVLAVCTGKPDTRRPAGDRADDPSNCRVHTGARR